MNIPIQELRYKFYLFFRNIIDFLFDEGFLTESMEDLFILLRSSLEITFQEIFAVLHKIQHLDPIGIGATSLKNCLLIQLDHFHSHHESYDSAKHMIEKLEDDIKPSMISFDAFVSAFKKNDIAKELVKSLNPKPGNIISESLHQEHITPDIIVVKRDSGWVVELNPSINPKIRINRAYKELMESITNKADQEYVKSNLQDAKFFLKALNNRGKEFENMGSL
mgnify:CR=1 FL=1